MCDETTKSISSKALYVPPPPSKEDTPQEPLKAMDVKWIIKEVLEYMQVMIAPKDEALRDSFFPMNSCDN